jgi:hypothetical protein
VSEERLRRWINLLPPNDRTQPITVIDGKQLSPEDILREVQSGTEIGKKALQLFATTRFGTEEQLLVDRLKQRLARYPPDKPLFITLGNNLTPQQAIAEVESRSAIGKRLLETERQYLKWTDSLKERV